MMRGKEQKQPQSKPKTPPTHQQHDSPKPVNEGAEDSLSPCPQADERPDPPPAVATEAASVMTEPADTACPSGLRKTPQQHSRQQQRGGG